MKLTTRSTGMRKTAALLLLFAGCLQAHAQDSFTASPFFDTHYGGAANGVVFTNFSVPQRASYASTVNTVPDGHVWLTGLLSSSGNQGGNLLFALFNSDGTPDSTFGPAHDGQLMLDEGDASINGATIASGNRLVFVGMSGTSGAAGLIGRLTERGALDTSFNGTGQRLIGATVFISAPTSDAALQAVAIQPDGKMVAVGVAATTVNGVVTTCMAVARLTSDGAFVDAASLMVGIQPTAQKLFETRRDRLGQSGIEVTVLFEV